MAFGAAPTWGVYARLDAESYADQRTAEFIHENFLPVGAHIKEHPAWFHRSDEWSWAHRVRAEEICRCRTVVWRCDHSLCRYSLRCGSNVLAGCVSIQCQPRSHHSG